MLERSITTTLGRAVRHAKTARSIATAMSKEKSVDDTLQDMLDTQCLICLHRLV